MQCPLVCRSRSIPIHSTARLICQLILSRFAYFSTIPAEITAPRSGSMLPPKTQIPNAHGLAPFNFIDLEDKAAKYITQVKEEAARVVAEAKNEVQRMRQNAAAEL